MCVGAHYACKHILLKPFLLLQTDTLFLLTDVTSLAAAYHTPTSHMLATIHWISVRHSCTPTACQDSVVSNWVLSQMPLAPTATACSKSHAKNEVSALLLSNKPWPHFRAAPSCRGFKQNGKCQTVLFQQHLTVFALFRNLL